jgi:hypothetical protein
LGTDLRFTNSSEFARRRRLFFAGPRAEPLTWGNAALII